MVRVVLTPSTGPLVDPTAAGPRRVVAAQKLNPGKLEDVRKAEAVGPRVSIVCNSSHVICPSLGPVR